MSKSAQGFFGSERNTWLRGLEGSEGRVSFVVQSTNRDILLFENDKILQLIGNFMSDDPGEFNVLLHALVGYTRSDLGRLCRDTFASLKKTCRKLGVAFWSYLADRLSWDSLIPWLPDLMRQRIIDSPG